MTHNAKKIVTEFIWQNDLRNDTIVTSVSLIEQSASGDSDCMETEDTLSI